MSNPRYHAVIRRITALHDRKSHDYAQDANPYSNFEFAATVAKDFADPVDRVFATMIGIKLARIAELVSSGKTPNNESLTDSFDDLSNYAVIWASYREPMPNQAEPKTVRDVLRALPDDPLGLGFRLVKGDGPSR